MAGSPPERDVLLATKLQVPRSRPGLVRRRRLADQLDEGLSRGLVVVAAPAGYGKSVVLSEWVRGMTEPVAWLSLDGGDNDPVRFWRHVLAALDVVRPGLAERLGPLAGPPAPPAYDALVSALINDVVADPGLPDVLLVLDDYHLISSDTLQASVRFLLDHRPPQLRVVLASRSDPPLGLARYRGRGELGEVRAADLRFTVDEAAELLRQVAADLDLAAAAALAERTEGWAVGLQLAALSLRTQPDVARFVAAFTGSHRYVLDYLTEEVLARQREDLRNFLLETSVLERLSGSLCNAVTGRDDSQDLLEEVDRSGLFVVQLDDVRDWWRYHHLFADLLRTRLEQDPEHARRLNRNAARWYEQQKLPDPAIRHALAAGEQEWAARLVEEHFDTVFNLRGEQATIQSWLPALPEELIRSRPRLLLAQAQMASMHGDLQTMEPLLDAAERVIGRADEEPFEPSTGPEGSLLVNARAMLALQRSYAAQLRGDAAATAALTREAMEQLRENELMLSSAVQGFLATAEWLHGCLDAAAEAFESSIGWWQRDGCHRRLDRGARDRLPAGIRPGLRRRGAGDGRTGHAGRRPVEPGHRQSARDLAGHRQEARQPCPGQAGRREPHRGGGARPRTRPDPLGPPHPGTPNESRRPLMVMAGGPASSSCPEEDVMVVTEYDVGPGAYGVALATDGAVWTSLTGRGELARVGPDGQVSRVGLDTGQSRPMVLARGPDGAIWFSRGDGRIGRIDPAGAVSSVPVLTPAGSPYGLCAGPDRTLWYTLLAADRVGRISLGGGIEEFPLPAGSMPSLITASPDGALWCTLNQAGAIGRITPTGDVTVYPLPTAGAAPVGIHAEGEAAWFAEIGAGQIGRIFPDGRIEEYPLPDRSCRPHAIAATPDGGCWATLWAASSVIRLDRDGGLAEEISFRPGSEPHGIAAGPDGSVWVALEAGFLAHLTR